MYSYSIFPLCISPRYFSLYSSSYIWTNGGALAKVSAALKKEVRYPRERKNRDKTSKDRGKHNVVAMRLKHWPSGRVFFSCGYEASNGKNESRDENRCSSLALYAQTGI